MTIAKPNRKGLSLLSWQTQSMRDSDNSDKQNVLNSSNGLFAYQSPPNIFYPPLKELSYLCCTETYTSLAIIEDPNCNLLLIPIDLFLLEK